MRRASIAAVVAALPLLAGCSGADALRAEQLLNESSQAQQRLKSESFTGRLSVSAEGQQFVVKMTGGAYYHGADAGDFYVDLELPSDAGLPTQLGSVRLVRRGGALSMTLGSTTAVLPVPASTARTTQGASSLGAFDLTRYVKDVKVEENRLLAGARVAKVTGVLDTSALVRALAPLEQLSSATGEQLPDASAFGDTRMVGYFSERTHRMLAALVDMSAHADGHTVQVHMDIGFQRFNKRVAFPAS